MNFFCSRNAITPPNLHLRRVRVACRCQLPLRGPLGIGPHLGKDGPKHPLDVVVSGGLGGTTTAALALHTLALPPPGVRDWGGLALAPRVMSVS